jgi:hypothetical protein
MYLKAFVSVLFFSFFSLCLSAQDCTLDIGGKNSETLIKVFQLNDVQVAQMETLSTELDLSNKALQEDIQKLFDSHPQSTPEELTTLADKYRVLQRKMVDASWEADKKLLTIFNERQYQRYLELCSEALRAPIKVIPTGVKDSIADPE